VAFDPGYGAGSLTETPFGANMAFRREAFEKHGGFRTDLGRCAEKLRGGEDSEFGRRLLAAGERLRYEPSAVVHHPVAECRMNKRYLLTWWFWHGHSGMTEAGPPSDARWLLGGVPLYLFRRLGRWTLQWLLSIEPSRRFSCKRSVWYLVGSIAGCYQWSRRGTQQSPPLTMIPHREADRRSAQADLQV
jgi:GT2 family glycosyltransferase